MSQKSFSFMSNSPVPKRTLGVTFCDILVLGALLGIASFRAFSQIVGSLQHGVCDPSSLENGMAFAIWVGHLLPNEDEGMRLCFAVEDQLAIKYHGGHCTSTTRRP